MMRRPSFSSRPLRPGIYSAIVTQRSTDSPAREIRYGVALQVPGGSQVQFVDIAPYPAKRLSRQDETLDLVPFEIGEPLLVHVLGSSHNVRVYIAEGEQPFLGPCSGGTP